MLSHLKSQTQQTVSPQFWAWMARCWWQLSPLARQSRQQLRQFKNKHRGERCFIIGNGPSLKRTDLSYLKPEFTFGLNRIYLLFDQIGFQTTYHVTVNRLVVEQFASEIKGVDCPKFVSWHNRDLVGSAENMTFILQKEHPDFYTDIENGLWDGTTVTYVALQLAYYMGFDPVILIGVDHYFKAQGEPHKTVTSQTDDHDHFAPNYFGSGTQWQLPDLATSERAYQLAKTQYERDNREVVDATVDGKLQLFRKVAYHSLF